MFSVFQAVECCQEECVTQLLEYKADVDARDCDSNTALHIAVKEGYTNLVARLIEAGADVNLKNKVIYLRDRVCSTPCK